MAKLDAEEKRSARKVNLVFAILMLGLLIIPVYVILHPDLDQRNSQSSAHSVGRLSDQVTRHRAIPRLARGM